MDKPTSRLQVIERLRQIANRAGAPTMEYSPTIAQREQRSRLNIIAIDAGLLIKDLLEDERADAKIATEVAAKQNNFSEVEMRLMLESAVASSSPEALRRFADPDLFGVRTDRWSGTTIRRVTMTPWTQQASDEALNASASSVCDRMAQPGHTPQERETPQNSLPDSSAPVQCATCDGTGWVKSPTVGFTRPCPACGSRWYL